MCRTPISLTMGRSARTPTSIATFATRSSTTPPSWPTPLSARRTLRTLSDLYTDIQFGTLPAVSFVKPSGLVDGHPASSKLDLFEGFSQKIVEAVQANPLLWSETAIMITFDEGGGYYDSGYVQPLDYFGDGTRIPMIVVSPYTKPGHISHDYSDHVSILKFIERNWNVGPVTSRSRDNLPNPSREPGQPVCAGQYVRRSATFSTCSTSVYSTVYTNIDPAGRNGLDGQAPRSFIGLRRPARPRQFLLTNNCSGRQLRPD